MKKQLIISAALFLMFHFSIGQNAGSLFTDIKAGNVGDVLSVIIVETANASRESKSNNSSKSDMDLDAGAKGNVASVLPSFGASSSLSSSYNGSDGTEQKERLTGRITVRIIEKTEGGMFKIKGERKLGVNGEENLMRLEGLVRPRDITTENTIYSYNIADAKITYRKSGIMNSFIKPGTFSKIFTWLIGGVMVAAATGYFVFN